MSGALPVVTFDPDEDGWSAIVAELGGSAEAVYLPRLDESSRRKALANATTLLARNTAAEPRGDEPALLRRARLVQFLTAGVDFMPPRDPPAGVPAAAKGACAEPVAEHAQAARATRRLGMRIHAIRRSPAAGGSADWTATPPTAWTSCSPPPTFSSSTRR